METYLKQNVKNEDFNFKINDDYSNIHEFYDYFDTNCFRFKKYNDIYVIKLNNNSNLKFFQDELTVKYNTKGVTTDFAVS